MKLLVSDYDGTLFTNPLQLRLNIEAIKRFIEKGNHFVIATGRGFESIKKEIVQNKIPYHYLITNDGLLTFDKDDICLHSYNFYSSVLEELKALCIERGYTPNTYICPMTGRIVEIEIQTKGLDVPVNVDIFMKNHSEIVQKEWILDGVRYDFFNGKVNKNDALQRLLEYLPLSYQSVTTVGNDINDVEMILTYNGYKITNNSDSIENYPFKTVESVHQLIKKIEG